MSANSPNPLVPQGSLQQQSGTAKSKVRVAVFSIIAVHAVLFVGVLMQGGCKKDEPKTEVVAEQPAAPQDPFHSDPAALAVSNTSTSSAPVAGAPAPVGDPFAQPGVPAAPTGAPVIPPTATTSIPPAPIAPGVGMAPEVGAPATTASFEPAPSVQQYSIAKNDNFYTIAKKFNTTTKKILEANPNVDPARLQVGQKINVPVSATAPVATGSVSAPASNGSSSTVNYEVRSGDTLYGIAKKHGTTAKAIKSANGMKTDRINVGQKLKVPSKVAASPAPEPVVAPAGVPVVTPGVPAVPGT